MGEITSHETGGLPYSRPNITDRARASAWRVRFDAQDYLENHKRVTYLNLLTSGRLNAHLYQTEQTALTEVGALTKQLAAERGVTGGAERKSPDAVARHDEQHPQPGGGN